MSALRPRQPRPFLPTTAMGRASAVLATIFLLVLGAQTTVTWITGDESPRAFLLFLAALGGVAGGAMALVSIVRHRDRSWAVYLAVAVATLPMMFVLVETLFPHA